MTLVKLTQFSKASGCGCKIAPNILEDILKGFAPQQHFEHLLVGNESKDDAAVYEWADGQCIVSTTDFFMPIVDDAYDFGRIAACNAISDVYAMGGKPIMAVAILGWPVALLPPEAAQQVLSGAQSVCTAAGIPLAGGHSVDSQEPIFGLAVTGVVAKQNLKRNSTLQENDILYLTKPLGIGILATALKRGLLAAEHYATLLQHTSQLNTIGAQLGAFSYVTAMTDVTGFGLNGHLLEMLHASGLSARITRSELPLIESSRTYAAQFVFPDNTTRNYNAQLPFIEGMQGLDFIHFCDPQTSGGLLFGVRPERAAEMDLFLEGQQQFFAKVGVVVAEADKKIYFI